MKRILAGAALVLALCSGSASGETFAIVGSGATPQATAGFSAQAVALPSTGVPNAADVLDLPQAWTEHASSEMALSSTQLRALWQSAGSAYGIPWSVLAAINKIESNFGRNMGPSSAGAVGWMQFMPGTWLRWGYDFDGDGLADPWNPSDAIFAAARYLAAAGGGSDISRAVFGYNHAQWYVDEVLGLANVLGGDGTLAFQLDALQISLEHAERRVADLGAALSKTLTRARALERQERRLEKRAERTELLSDKGVVQMKAVEVGTRAYQVREQANTLKEKLLGAEQTLKIARDRSLAASFNPAVSSYLASPRYGDGYVFPVGGGPSRVSVARTHHDYPAADIAAPYGSPVYALANGTVESAWRTIDPLCGIGFIYRSDDGQRWAYCHLSYLEPSVTDGARFSAGSTVGLVGSTGHSTGPHLHLALKPELGYPQDEAWFQRFAGIAFRWQDESLPTLTTSGSDVQLAFAIVTDDSSLIAPETADTPAVDTKTTRAGSEGGPRSIFAPTPFDKSKDENGEEKTQSEAVAKSFAVIPGS